MEEKCSLNIGCRQTSVSALIVKPKILWDDQTNFEWMKVTGFIKKNLANSRIINNLVTAIMIIIFRYQLFTDLFDSDYVGDYVELLENKSVAKDTGAVSRPRSLMNTSYLTFCKSNLNNGQFWRFIKIRNYGSTINYGGLVIGVAKSELVRIGSTIPGLYPQGMLYIFNLCYKCKDIHTSM